MAEPESKRQRKFNFFWMAEPGHPHEVGVLHKRPPAAGTHKPLRKEHQEGICEKDFNLFDFTHLCLYGFDLPYLCFLP
jgi:hypothetical protein